VAQLRLSKLEFEARHTRVTLISFGTNQLAQAWITETQTDFQFLIDHEKKAYRAYGLERSILRSWRPKIWFEYAKLFAQGRKWRGIQGDSGQLGGDFVIDQSGIIRMAYRSFDPADRPAVSDILGVLDKINRDQLG
jgi:peroxiredoxin